MKAKTRFRLVILVAVAMAAGAGLGGYIVYHRHQKAVNMVMWREQGLKAFADSDYGKTLELLGLYEPSHEQITGKGDVEVLYAMARARLRLVEPNGRYLRVAQNSFSQVVDLDPTNDDAKRTLLGLYSRLNMVPEAISLADAMLVTNSQDLDALRAKASALLALRKYTAKENHGEPGARETLQRILKIKPLDLDAHQLTLLLISEDKTKTTVAQDQDFINYAKGLFVDGTGAPKNIDDPSAEIIASTAYRFGKDEVNGKKYALMAASRKTNDHDTVMLITHQLDSMGLYDEATHYLDARAQATASDETRRDWALRLLYRNRLQDVLTYLNTDNTVASDADADTMAVKCYTLVRLEKSAEAQGLIAILKSSANARAAAWAKLLDASLMDETNARDKTSAGITGAKARFDDIKTAVNAQLENSPLAIHLAAKAWALRGYIDEAADLWTKAATMVPVWAEPLVSESRMQLANRSFMVAASLAERARQRLPDDPEVEVAFVCAASTVIAPTDKTSMDRILQTISKIEAAVPGESHTLPIKMLYLVGVGRKADAMKVVDDALAIKPPPGEADMVSLARVAAGDKTNNFERILNAAQEANKARFDKSPNAVDADGLTANLAFVRAGIWLDLDPSDHGIKGLKYLEDKLTGPRANDLNWLMTHAVFLDQIGDKRAAEVWSNLADNYHDDSAVQWAALRSQALRSNYPVRDRILTRLESMETARNPVKFYRAHWYFETDSASTPVPDRIKSFQKADELLKEFLAVSPGSVTAHLLRAQALEMLDALQHPGQAPQLLPMIDELKTARSLDPGDTAILLQLAEANLKQGDLAGIPDLLQPLLSKDFPASTAQRYQAANLLASAGKSDQAMTLLGMLPEPDTNEQCRLAAGLYQLKGLNAKAERLVLKILEHPDEIDIMFAAQYYADTNRTDLAGTTIKLLDKLILPPGQKALELANFYLAHGNLPDAQNQVLQAIQEAPTESAPRRQLICLRVLQGDVKGTQEAIRTGAKEVHDDPILQQALANVDVLTHLVTQPGLRELIASALKDPALGAGSMDAIQILANAENKSEMLTDTSAKLRPVADAHPRNLDLQMLMIEAYAGCGRMADARAVADRAMEAFPNNPDPARLAANTLASLHQWEDVILKSAEWKHRAPQQALLADQRIADAQIYLGRPADALATLQPYLPAARIDPDNFAQAIILYDRALLLANRFDDARAFMRPLLKKNAEWRIVTLTLIVDGVGSNQQVAVDWMNELDPLMPPKTMERARFAQAWFNLSDRFGNLDFSKKSRAILEEVAANPDCPADLLATLGMVYEVLGDPQNAETMYSRALKQNSADPFSANNLAMIYVRRGDKLDVALNLIDTVIQARPSVAAFRDTRASVLEKQGDLKGALESAKKAVSLEPDNADWALTLLDLQMKTNDPGARATRTDLEARKPTMTPAQVKKLELLSAPR